MHCCKSPTRKYPWQKESTHDEHLISTNTNDKSVIKSSKNLLIYNIKEVIHMTNDQGKVQRSVTQQEISNYSITVC